MAAGTCFRLGSFLLAAIAAITIGLGVSVFVSTYYLLFGPYCGYSYYGCTYAVPGLMAFIFPGIWGSVGVFICGLLGLRSYRDPVTWRAYLTVISLFTAGIFVPAMIAMSVTQAVMVAQPSGSLPALYSLTDMTPSQNILLFILPVLVAAFGGVEWFILLAVFIYACCYLSPNDVTEDRAPSQQPGIKPYTPFGAVPYSPYGMSNSPYGVLPYRRPYLPSPAAPAGYGVPTDPYAAQGPLAIRRPVPPPIIDPRRINAFQPYGGGLPYRRPLAPLPSAYGLRPYY